MNRLDEIRGRRFAATSDGPPWGLVSEHMADVYGHDSPQFLFVLKAPSDVAFLLDEVGRLRRVLKFADATRGLAIGGIDDCGDLDDEATP